MHDVFERRREQLDAVANAVEMCCSQVGMLAAIGGRFVVLDHVSEVEAFAALARPARPGLCTRRARRARGLHAAPPSIDDARDFIDLLLRAPCKAGPAVGLGEGLRFAFGGLAGTGLIVRARAGGAHRVRRRTRRTRADCRRPRPPSVPSPPALTLQDPLLARKFLPMAGGA